MVVDWVKQRDRYVTDGTVTLEQIARDVGVKFQTVRKRSMKESWAQQRQLYNNQKSTKVLEAASTTEAEAAARHIKIARSMQAKVLGKWQNVKPEQLTVTQALAYMVAALEIERKALGMEVSRVDVIHHSPPAEPPREALELLRDELERTLN